MYLVGLHTATQCGVNALVALNQALPLKGTGDNGGVPMPAIAREFNVFAVQAGTDDGLEFLAGHVFEFWGLVANLVAGTQHVDGNGTDKHQRR